MIYNCIYTYDAYGNILNISSLSSIAEINPFRYKGYYYDQETNLYYCKSRYYSPEVYRWISRDEIEYLDTSNPIGCNLYVYCNSNPVMYVDEEGNYSVTIEDASLVAFACCAMLLFGAASAAISNSTDQSSDCSQSNILENANNFIKSAIGEFSKELDKIKNIIIALISTIVVKKIYNSFEKHHIVAKNDRRAALSRMVLEKCNIGIDDEINLVYVKKEYHKVLHTNTYYVVLNYSITMAYFIAGENGVKEILFLYKMLLGGL